MTEITLKLDDPAKTAELLKQAARYAGSDGWDHLSAQHARWLADKISEQVHTPAVEEPEAFGSIVRARYPGNQTDSFLWQMAPEGRGRHYWESEHGAVEVWSELTDVEVLRVGVGLVNEDNAAFNEGVYEGKREMNTQIHVRVVSLRENTPLVVEQRAYEKVLQAVEELAP